MSPLPVAHTSLPPLAVATEMVTGWPTAPVVQDHMATPRASVRGADATGVQVTADAGVIVGPVGGCEAQGKDIVPGARGRGGSATIGWSGCKDRSGQPAWLHGVQPPHQSLIPKEKRLNWAEGVRPSLQHPMQRRGQAPAGTAAITCDGGALLGHGSAAGVGGRQEELHI